MIEVNVNVCLITKVLAKYPWSVSVNQWKIDKKEIYWGRHRISDHGMEAQMS